MKVNSLLSSSLCCLLAFALATASSQAQSAASAPALPQVRFNRRLANHEIAPSLASRLASVAAHHGKSEAELRQLISRDKCLCADQEAHLYYACTVPVAAGTASTARATLAPLTITSRVLTASTAAAAPVLHSRPNSTKKIYLDFDGHTTTNTYWNSSSTASGAVVTPPLDLDGVPASLSTTETERITGIWARVAEDYAPFDVDVTTEDPGADNLSRSGSTDTNYGIRVCIGGSSSDWFGQSAGGVAYLGSFIWSTDVPCFVFTAQLGGGNEKFTAEAISHEVGHTLGLNHDGVTGVTEYYTGHGDWAPIMGVGYYKNVTQWSKGEYTGASNLQDDIAVMASYGATAIPDDHGNTQTTATSLTGGTALSASGLISTRTETDLFRFSTGAGAISFQAQPAIPAPNLDIQLALYNSTGALVSTANPADLSSTLSTTVAAGTYFLAVDGVGTGAATTAYNDYGSLGAYRLTGSVLPVTSQPPVASTANTTPKTGSAPLTVAFSSIGSYDPDGTLTSYRWDFGDGSAAETMPNPIHLYSKAGTYTATLVVTDNSGLTASSSVIISVGSTAVTMSITSITLTLNPTSRGTSVTARVSVKDSRGLPVSGASFSGAWSGLFAQNVTGKTNNQGLVAFTSLRTKLKGTVTFTAKNLAKTGLLYAPTLNVETADSVTIR